MNELYRLKELLYKYRYQPFSALILFASAEIIADLIIFLATGYYIFSVLLFIYFLSLAQAFIVHKGNHSLLYTMTFITITLTIIISMFFAGIDCGAHFFLLSSALLFLQMGINQKPFVLWLAFLCLAEYIFIQFVFSNIEPVYAFTTTTIMSLSQVNIIISIVVVVYSTITYLITVKPFENQSE